MAYINKRGPGAGVVVEGKRLFCRNGDSLMVVAIETDPVFTPGVPRFPPCQRT